ncbi:atrial natriuretic peptide receptor 1-like [Paramacrobiotus metropolitanus]|uniref:atrial natriuretic peptide receptor 1-like n=1 Tax=Paramacrobiotus metropolitanus TaxID=2943436 RepID=UPI002445E0C6|nr:atrial natriuretic peptide receptor 1-like [Paramacrobiotus metropolitanus]
MLLLALISFLWEVDGVHLRKVNVTILMLQPYSSLAYTYDYYGPVTDMAIEEMNRRYPRFNFYKRMYVPKSNKTCSDLEAMESVMLYEYLLAEYRNRTAAGEQLGVTVLSGTACSVALRWMGDLARELNLPHIASGGSAAYMANPKRFTTTIKIQVYRQQDVGDTLVAFLRRYNWTNVAIICDDNPGLGDFILLSCNGFIGQVKAQSDMQYYDLHYDSSRTPLPDYDRFLKLAAERSRIICLTALGTRVRDIMVAAHRLGMTNGYFVFITSYPFEHSLYGWFKWLYNDGKDDEAKEAFKSLYFIYVKQLRGPEFAGFETEVKYRAFRDYGMFYEPLEHVNGFTAFQHTIVRYAAKLINDTDVDWSTITLNDGKGLQIVNGSVEEQEVESITGPGLMIKNKDRAYFSYTIVTMDHVTYEFKEIFSYETKTRILLPDPNNTVTWAYRGDSPPPNMPSCGYKILDNQCEISHAFIIGISLGIGIPVIVFAITIGILARRTSKLQVVDDPFWYIPVADIVMEDPESIKSDNKFKEVKSKTSKPVVRRHEDYAMYKDKKVWFRKLPLMYKYNPTSADEKLIKRMKAAGITTNTLLRFYGFCPMEMEMGVVYELSPRGNLVQVMQAGTVRFDMLLKKSVIMDLTSALLYIHSSPLEHHGALSRYTCLFDHRLALKLADYRLDILPRVQPRFTLPAPEHKAFLTFAPEQLRADNIYLGSRAGDCYSYGFVLTEILCEIEPFQTEIETANYSVAEIIDMLQQGSTKPFRPVVPLGSVANQFAPLVKQCWEEEPIDRPSIQYINNFIRGIPGFQRQYNLVDELIRRLTAHAELLESRISAATQGLLAEKRREEELLLQMLPKHVVIALTRGEKIDPEGFNCVTIGFTALENFGVIALTSTPFQLVTLLNDLYSIFDDTLPRFNVYKVETISDSYMIASGLPIRNGNAHSQEIASVAIELMRESSTVKSSSAPDGLLQMKIGFHTGPCVAGVVGLRMPRYCLFGDTINMASRMTSSGQAFKIQVSSEAREHLSRHSGKGFRFHFRGVVEIKGKGPQPCYWLLTDNGSTMLPPTAHLGDNPSSNGSETGLSSRRGSHMQRTPSSMSMQRQLSSNMLDNVL